MATEKKMIQAEKDGMREAEKFFSCRDRNNYSRKLVQFFGDQVYRKRAMTNDAFLHARGAGFRDMAYIISQGRRSS